MGRLAALLCALIISLAIISAGGAEMMNPEQMPETEGLPELLRKHRKTGNGGGKSC